MKYIDNDIRRQHLRLEELIPLYLNTDEHGRTLDMTGAKIVQGHQEFIDYCLSNIKIPDLFIDSSTKHWKVILGKDVLFTLIQFLDGNICNSDGETINDLPYYAQHRFKWLSLEMNALNPGAKDRDRITKIIQTTYNQT